MGYALLYYRSRSVTASHLGSHLLLKADSGQARMCALESPTQSIRTTLPCKIEETGQSTPVLQEAYNAFGK